MRERYIFLGAYYLSLIWLVFRLEVIEFLIIASMISLVTLYGFSVTSGMWMEQNRDIRKLELTVKRVREENEKWKKKLKLMEKEKLKKK